MAKGHTEEGPGGIVMKSWGSPAMAGAQYAPVQMDGQWKDMQPFPSDVPLDTEEAVWTRHAQEMQRACVKRHAPYSVFSLMLDWSVRKVTIKELWLLHWNRDWPDMCDPASPFGLPNPWPAWMEDVMDPCIQFK
jgi:hypothetical protein